MVSLLVGLVGLVAGIKVNTSATNFAPISQLQLAKFKGETWERFVTLSVQTLVTEPVGGLRIEALRRNLFRLNGRKVIASVVVLVESNHVIINSPVTGFPILHDHP